MTLAVRYRRFFTPIAETVGVLNELKAKGKIRSIGAADMNVSHIREYLKHMASWTSYRRNTAL